MSRAAANRRADRIRNAVRAFLRERALAYQNGASYEDTCFRRDDVGGELRRSGQSVTDLELYDALEAAQIDGLAEYHRPREAPAYWRATNKAAREIQ